MKIKNCSETVHTYTPRDRRRAVPYQWGPGETKEVPDDIGESLLLAHPATFEKVE